MGPGRLIFVDFRLSIGVDFVPDVADVMALGAVILWRVNAK